MDVKKYLTQIDQLFFFRGRQVKHKICEGLDDAINPVHIHLLKFIQQKEKCIVTDIAHYFSITLSAVTGSVDKLVKMELVTRERSEEDRRIVVIKLTDEGKRVLEKADANRLKLFEKGFSNLSHEEVEGFFDTLNKVISNISDHDEPTT
ncbi:MAG: MarR family transcriptional regulator [Firmicutes bacterium]|nr:MarR family transcriptional regulator [Bacillota bacterium]